VSLLLNAQNVAFSSIDFSGTGTLTFFQAITHFVISHQRLFASFCSAVLGFTNSANFCHHLNAHAKARFHHAPIATLCGVISHLLPISYFAHAIAHSVANWAGRASFHNDFTAQTLFGHIRLVQSSTPVRQIVAHTDLGL
jgi:hypothetical protein